MSPGRTRTTGWCNTAMAAGIGWPGKDEEKIPRSRGPSSLSSVRLQEVHGVPSGPNNRNLTGASQYAGPAALTQPVISDHVSSIGPVLVRLGEPFDSSSGSLCRHLQTARRHVRF
jgi:hypothetical protein